MDLTEPRFIRTEITVTEDGITDAKVVPVEDPTASASNARTFIENLTRANKLFEDLPWVPNRDPLYSYARPEDHSMDAMAYGLTRGDRFVGMKSDGMWIMDIHQEEVAMKEIKITPVLNGFIVKVGCQELVFDSVAKMTKALTEYCGAEDLAEMERVQDRWLEKSLNSGKIGPPQPTFGTIRVGGND